MPAQPGEIAILTYSQQLHNHPVTLPDIVRALQMTVTNVNGKMCFLRDVRIDHEERTIYVQASEIPTYGEYK